MTDKILFPSELGADFLQQALRSHKPEEIMGILKDTFELASKLAFLCPDSPMADFSPAFVRTLVAEGVTNGDPKFGAYLLDAATDILSAQTEAGTADIKRWLESVAANRSDNDALRLSAAKAGLEVLKMCHPHLFENDVPFGGRNFSRSVRRLATNDFC